MSPALERSVLLLMLALLGAAYYRRHRAELLVLGVRACHAAAEGIGRWAIAGEAALREGVTA